MLAAGVWQHPHWAFSLYAAFKGLYKHVLLCSSVCVNYAANIRPHTPAWRCILFLHKFCLENYVIFLLS